MTREQKREKIAKLLNNGLSVSMIRKRTGAAAATIYKIKRGVHRNYAERDLIGLDSDQMIKETNTFNLEDFRLKNPITEKLVLPTYTQSEIIKALEIINVIRKAS